MDWVKWVVNKYSRLFFGTDLFKATDVEDQGIRKNSSIKGDDADCINRGELISDNGEMYGAGSAVGHEQTGKTSSSGKKNT